MIEVEKNFDLKPGEKERLIKGAKFLRKITFQDVYYDNKSFDLTRNDYWFRKRDSRWELKVPLNKESIKNRLTDQYREIEDKKGIAKELGFKENANILQSVSSLGYEPFAVIITNRETYQKGDFHLDFDEMDFGFKTFEAELMVESINEVSLAEKRILDFASEHGITETKGRGKVTEYLARFKPEHYKTLLQSGIVE